MERWMESPCDWHLEPARCFRMKSTRLSAVWLQSAFPALWLVLLTPRSSCWRLLMLICSMLLGCRWAPWPARSCLHLACCPHPALSVSFSQPPPLLPSWEAGPVPVDAHSTSGVLFTHWIASAKVLQGVVAPQEGTIGKWLNRGLFAEV